MYIVDNDKHVMHLIKMFNINDKYLFFLRTTFELSAYH